MSPLRKQLLDQFTENLKLRYHRHCQRHGHEHNLENLIDFLIDQELISGAAIRKFTIIQEFDKLFPRQKHKTQTVNMLADRFNISERSVWLALKGRKDLKK